MTKLICYCDRCSWRRLCTFVGEPSDVDGGKAQNGEWLCDACLEPRLAELDAAVAKFNRMLSKGE